MADINEIVAELERLVPTLEVRGVRPIDARVRPSGDDVDVIKVWVDLGPTSVDAHDWATECERILGERASGFRVQVRAEKL